jgi:hypothetical protein
MSHHRHPWLQRHRKASRFSGHTKREGSRATREQVLMATAAVLSVNPTFTLIKRLLKSRVQKNLHRALVKHFRYKLIRIAQFRAQLKMPVPCSKPSRYITIRSIIQVHISPGQNAQLLPSNLGLQFSKRPDRLQIGWFKHFW